MSKTKLQQAEEVRAQIEQLQNKEKLLLQQHKEQERKARTHRICQRGGHLESLLPDTIKLTEEQFDTFLKRTAASELGRRILADIIVQSGETAQSSNPSEAVPLYSAASTSKTPIQANGDNAVLTHNSEIAPQDGGLAVAANADNDARIKG